MDPSYNYGGGSESTRKNLYPDLNSYTTPTSSEEVPSSSTSAQKTANDKNNSSSSTAWQAVPINSEHDPSAVAEFPPSASSSSSASPDRRTASTGSIQESLEINNAGKDTDSILSSLNRKNKNLAPIFTRDYYGESGGVGRITAGVGKGWKGLSSLEKSLSVSLGVVSTLSLALMIAVIVIGVQLNEENNCKLVSVTQPTTECPTLPTTTPKDDRCDSTTRPRPPRRGVTTTPSPPVTDPVTGEDGGTTDSQIILNSAAVGSSGSTCLVSDQHDNATICLTPQCFRMAGKIMESIDFDANPCQNFYQFSCGNWIKSSSGDKSENIRRKLLLEIKGLLETTEPSLQNSSTEQPKTRAFSLAQQFYHSCMHPLLDDEVAVAEVRVLLDTMTSAPPVISTKMQRLSFILANIRRYLNGNYVIGMEVAADDKQTKKNAIYLTQPQFGLPSLLQELDIDLDQSDGKIPALYKNLVQKLWSLVYPEESDVATLERIWRDLEDFEGKLKRISEQNDTEELQDPQEQNYNLLSQMNTTNMSQSMISWLTGLTNLILTSPTTTNITDLTNMANEKLPKVVLKNVKYFKELENILVGSNYVTIANYLQLRILLSYAPHSGEIFSDLVSEFKRKVEGIDATYKPKWQTCAEETNNLFGWAVSHRLIQLSSNSMMAMQENLNETAYYLKDSLKESICSAPWISQNKTRLAGKRKLESLEAFLGFPKEWLEEASSNTSTNAETFDIGNSFVESFYSDMNFTDALNYLQNYVETRMWLSRKQLEEIRESSLGSESCGDSWPKFQYPSSSKAFYSEQLNYLALPFGVIDTSSSSLLALVGDSTLEFPALQYGSVGVFMAQLMLQGFDEKGSYRNESGNIDPWWDIETRENYRNLSTCFLDQFENSMNSLFADDYNNNDVQESSPDSVVDDVASLAFQDDPTDGTSKSQNVTHKNKAIDTISSQRIKNNNKLIRKLILQNGALALAYRAYHSQSFEQEFDEMLLPGLENFTPEQLFFLTFVQGQCSSLSGQRSAGEVLVENMLQNSIEFATHWKCPLPDEGRMCRIF